MGRNNNRTQRAVVEQMILNESSIDVELRDQAFEVELSNLFLQVAGNSPDNIDGSQRAKYLLPRDSSQTSQGGSRLTFTLELKSISDGQFTVFGTFQNKSQIRTFIKVTGLQSGAVKEFEVRIDKNQ